MTDWIVHEDDELIVVNKPATLPVQNDQSADQSLLRIMEQYVGQQLFLINRIDRPVSGLVLLAKKPYGQSKFASNKITKRYVAMTHKNNTLVTGELRHFHSRNGRTKKAYISDIEKPSLKAITMSIEDIHPLDNYDIIKLSIISGRFHQIRAQLAHIGSPIKGDVKYGARRANKDRSIMLHAYQYELEEPHRTYSCLPDLEHNLWKEVQLLLSI